MPVPLNARRFGSYLLAINARMQEMFEKEREEFVKAGGAHVALYHCVASLFDAHA